MAKHQLISFYLNTHDHLLITITLFKQVSRYNICSEYFKENDKIKETNHEVDRNFVYQLFCDLEKAGFEELNDGNEDAIMSLRVYYGSLDYLQRHLSKEMLKQSKEMNDVVEKLLEFVDNRELLE